jgi:hypothetical protein
MHSIWSLESELLPRKPKWLYSFCAKWDEFKSNVFDCLQKYLLHTAAFFQPDQGLRNGQMAR